MPSLTIQRLSSAIYKQSTTRCVINTLANHAVRPQRNTYTSHRAKLCCQSKHKYHFASQSQSQQQDDDESSVEVAVQAAKQVKPGQTPKKQDQSSQADQAFQNLKQPV